MMVTVDGIIYSLQGKGGISVYFDNLIAMLEQRGIQSQLVLYNKNHEVLESNASVEHVYRSPRLLERYRRCAVVKEQGAIFHSTYYRLPEGSIPSVVTVHDFIYEKATKGARKHVHVRQKHSAIKHADTIICVSESTKEDLLKFVGIRQEQRLEVIHNGVSDDYEANDTNWTGRPYLLFVGARNGYKNFNYLVSALRHLDIFDLYCVGGGSFSKRELGHVDSKTKARIRHLGVISNKDLNFYYNNAFALMYPSSYEGFGIPVVEAMRAGCPVVVSPDRALLEVGGNAVTVLNNLAVESFKEAITKLNSSCYRAEKISLGLARAMDFSWEKTHSKTINIYLDML